MTQLTKFLPGKHETLSLIPRTHRKKLDVVLSAYNPCAEEVKQNILGYRVASTRLVRSQSNARAL